MRLPCISKDKIDKINALTERNKSLKIRSRSELRKNAMTFSLLYKNTEKENSLISNLPSEIIVEILTHTRDYRVHSEIEAREIIYDTLANAYIKGQKRLSN